MDGVGTGDIVDWGSETRQILERQCVFSRRRDLTKGHPFGICLAVRSLLTAGHSARTHAPPSVRATRQHDTAEDVCTQFLFTLAALAVVRAAPLPALAAFAGAPPVRG